MRSEWNNYKVVVILLIVSLVSCAQSVEPESMVPTAEPTFTPIPTLQSKPTPIQNTPTPIVIVVTATPMLTPIQTPTPLSPKPTSTPIQNTPTPIVIVVTATPTLTPTQTPTLLAPPIFTPTAVRDTLPAASATQIPMATQTPAPTRTVTPTPTLTPIPLPLELTGGVKALVACAGRDEEYWLRSGPPRMTLELVQCLNAELEIGR